MAHKLCWQQDPFMKLPAIGISSGGKLIAMDLILQPKLSHQNSAAPRKDYSKAEAYYKKSINVVEENGGYEPGFSEFFINKEKEMRLKGKERG